MNSWASDFLDEDNDMPSWYNGSVRRAVPREVLNAYAREAAHRAITKAREAQKQDEAKPLNDKYYADMLLMVNGICPECLYMFIDCECEDLPFADKREVTG